MERTACLTACLVSALASATLALSVLFFGAEHVTDLVLHYGHPSTRVSRLVGHDSAVKAAATACPLPAGPLNRTEKPWLSMHAANVQELRAAQDAGVRVAARSDRRSAIVRDLLRRAVMSSALPVQMLGPYGRNLLRVAGLGSRVLREQHHRAVAPVRRCVPCALCQVPRHRAGHPRRESSRADEAAAGSGSAVVPGLRGCRRRRLA